MRQRKIVETAPGWRDGSTMLRDLTRGEYDTMAAVLEMAWQDAQIDLDLVPPSRREEALAAKVTAFRWLKDDNWEARISFRFVCEALGLDPAKTRAYILTHDYEAYRRGERVVKVATLPPTMRVPPKWDRIWSDEDREDREYRKRRRSTTGPEAALAASSQLLLPFPCSFTGGPDCPIEQGEHEGRLSVIGSDDSGDLDEPETSGTEAFCPVLDAPLDPLGFEALANAVSSIAPDEAEAAAAVWTAAVAAREEDDG